MNTIDPTLHRTQATQVKFTDNRLLSTAGISWPHRLAAIAVGDIVAAYFATLPFTGLTRMDPATLPLTPYGVGLFASYAIIFAVAGLPPALLMAKTQLEKGFPTLGVSVIWGVLIGAFVYAMAILFAAARAGFAVSPDWTSLIGFLALPAVFIGALGGLAGWGYLTLIKKHLSGWA